MRLMPLYYNPSRLYETLHEVFCWQTSGRAKQTQPGKVGGAELLDRVSRDSQICDHETNIMPGELMSVAGD
jgi:hypothetical protein